jgi:esterase/lipase superfamily enzyme
LFRLQFREDPSKHVVLLTLAELGPDAWQSEIRQALATCSARDVLLFIHGYNVDFEQAALRAAQFAYDLEFQGACVLYSCRRKAPR